MRIFYQNHLLRESQEIQLYGEKGFTMSIDYTSYSADDTKDIETSGYVDVIDEKVDELDLPETIVEVEEEVKDEITMMGVVANTEKVYLRQDPSKDGAVVVIMDKGDEVMIDGTKDDTTGNGWYHVTTAKGAEGYVMSDYIDITVE